MPFYTPPSEGGGGGGGVNPAEGLTENYAPVSNGADGLVDSPIWYDGTDTHIDSNGELFLDLFGGNAWKVNEDYDFVPGGGTSQLGSADDPVMNLRLAQSLMGGAVHAMTHNTSSPFAKVYFGSQVGAIGISIEYTATATAGSTTQVIKGLLQLAAVSDGATVTVGTLGSTVAPSLLPSGTLSLTFAAAAGNQNAQPKVIFSCTPVSSLTTPTYQIYWTCRTTGLQPTQVVNDSGSDY